MNRHVINQLLEWKNSDNRKPLVLKGARQVGKTWLMKEFGKNHYEDTFYFNFDEEDELKSIFEKSLAINKNLPENHIITFDDLESKKPKGYGISATDFQKVIGKKLNKEKSKWDFLTEEDIEWV